MTITSLRDPIDRIISSYWFEGRELERKATTSTTAGKGELVDFATYVDNVRKNEIQRGAPVLARFVWKSGMYVV